MSVGRITRKILRHECTDRTHVQARLRKVQQVIRESPAMSHPRRTAGEQYMYAKTKCRSQKSVDIPLSRNTRNNSLPHTPCCGISTFLLELRCHGYIKTRVQSSNAARAKTPAWASQCVSSAFRTKRHDGEHGRKENACRGPGAVGVGVR
jgi:hypothetical protein